MTSISNGLQLNETSISTITTSPRLSDKHIDVLTTIRWRDEPQCLYGKYYFIREALGNVFERPPTLTDSVLFCGTRLKVLSKILYSRHLRPAVFAFFLLLNFPFSVRSAETVTRFAIRTTVPAKRLGGGVCSAHSGSIGFLKLFFCTYRLLSDFTILTSTLPIIVFILLSNTSNY